MKITKVAALASLILLLVCAGCSREKRFDIRGEWSFSSDSKEIYIFSFSGSLEAGTLVGVEVPNIRGTYSVSGNEVVFDYAYVISVTASGHFQGSFLSEDHISGKSDMVQSNPPKQWTLELEGQRRRR